jgi:outer membrane receptor protein involved in Fe transport
MLVLRSTFVPGNFAGRAVSSSSRARPGLVALVLATIALAPSDVLAQARTKAEDSTARADSLGRPRLEPVVITAERASASLGTSTAALTRLSSAMLQQLPVRTIADALRYVPGMVVLQSDGLGGAPRLVVRGFYGGGETEYVTVLLDGVPTTELVSGLVNWDLIPLEAVESIEVLRGGASSLYGDAALGGVVNVITRRDRAFSRWRVSGGQFGQAQGGGAIGGALDERPASVFADLQRSTGFRAHERRGVASVGGSVALASSATHSLTLGMLNHWRTFDEPGPLADSALLGSRRSIAPFYRFDNAEQRIHRLTLDGTRNSAEARTVRGYLTAEYARTDAVRTLPLSPQFADTKGRSTNVRRAVGSLQLETSAVPLGWTNRLVVGTDVSVGGLASDYRPLLSGNASQYLAASPTLGDVSASGSGSRQTAAAFASWELVPAGPLRLSLGGRYDWIEDRYEPRSPSAGEKSSASRVAFSPRAGANLRYLESARQTGNLYVTAGRSFKAPTMDQLFDQRPIPVPFPPYSITTSNAGLEAQYGSTVEAGIYHRATLVPERFSARLALSAYQTDMRNELDFDLQSFRYVNLGRSRHRGVEAGVTLDAPSAMSGFVNYTQQDATSRYGPNEGRFLKAIPRRVLVAGIARAASTGVSATLSSTTMGATYLDDANTLTLPGHTQIDARASYPIRHLRVSLDLRNVLGREYSSTGYQDPAGGPTAYYYPAAGRVLMLAVESGR